MSADGTPVSGIAPAAWDSFELSAGVPVNSLADADVQNAALIQGMGAQRAGTASGGPRAT